MFFGHTVQFHFYAQEDYHFFVLVFYSKKIALCKLM